MRIQPMSHRWAAWLSSPADPRSPNGASSSHVTPEAGEGGGRAAPLTAPPAASSVQPSPWLACCAAKPTASAICHSAWAGTAPSLDLVGAGAFSNLTRLAGGRTLARGVAAAGTGLAATGVESERASSGRRHGCLGCACLRIVDPGSEI